MMTFAPKFGMRASGLALPDLSEAMPAVLNAEVDALWRGYGISHIEMPTTPQRVWQAITAAQALQA